MKTRTMVEAKDHIRRIVRMAEKEEVLITRHGEPATVVIGFKDYDDGFDYRVEHDEAPRERSPRPCPKSEKGRLSRWTSCPSDAPIRRRIRPETRDDDPVAGTAEWRPGRG